MNRIQQMATTLPPVTPLRRASAAKYESTSEAAVSLFCPQHYESHYAYPLIVWLHGPRDNESQLKRVMPHVSLRNYVAVAPRGPSPCDRNTGRSFNWSQSPADYAIAEERVFDSISHASSRLNINERRIFLAGFDRGGTLAFRIAMTHAERFAGVISIGGAFPEGHAPLSRLTHARRVPLLLACGRDSSVYSTGTVCEHLRLFHAAGMNVALRQYPCGQEIAPMMLGDMDRWIMEQINSPSIVASDECA